MRCSFSLIAASAGAFVLAALCNCALAQSGYNSYHRHDTYSHSSGTSQAPLAAPYHSFTMDAPYAPSFTPHNQYGPVHTPTTPTSPSGSFWHNNLGNSDTGAAQRRAAGATVVPPYVPPATGQPHSSTPSAISRMRDMYPNAEPWYMRSQNSQRVHEHHNDAPPGE